jgi:hypothetical protein
MKSGSEEYFTLNFRFSPVSIIPAVLHALEFFLHRHHILLAIERHQIIYLKKRYFTVRRENICCISRGIMREFMYLFCCIPINDLGCVSNKCTLFIT